MLVWVTVKSLSEAHGLSLTLASMVGEAASIFAEPLVTSVLAAVWMATSQRNNPPAMLAALEFSSKEGSDANLR
jgi:hypothetical protein